MELDYRTAARTLTGPWLERRDQSRAREMLAATVLAKPTDSPTVNIHARAVYRALAHLKELARVSDAAGRDGFARNVAAAADAAWASLQILIAETNGSVPTCVYCRGALDATTGGTVWVDEDIRALAHATPTMCGREIMERASA